MADESELKPSEIHPSAYSAMEWFNKWRSDLQDYFLLKESLASTAIEGNRTAQICLGTLERLEKNEKVSDRYLLGLVWFIRDNVIERKAIMKSLNKVIKKGKKNG